MNDKNKLNKLAFWPAIICLGIFIAFGVFKQDAMGTLLNTILYAMADRVGWFFELIAILIIILTFVLATSKSADRMPSRTLRPGTGLPCPCAVESEPDSYSGQWGNRYSIS